MIKINMIPNWAYGQPLSITYVGFRKAGLSREECLEFMRWYLFDLRDRMRRKFRVL